jgi:hypothetical protein
MLKNSIPSQSIVEQTPRRQAEKEAFRPLWQQDPTPAAFLSAPKKNRVLSEDLEIVDST